MQYHSRTQEPEIDDGESYAEKYGRKDIVNRAFASVHKLNEREKQENDSRAELCIRKNRR